MEGTSRNGEDYYSALYGKKSQCDKGDFTIEKIAKINWFCNLVVNWSLKTSSGCKPFKGATNFITWGLYMACCKERP